MVISIDFDGTVVDSTPAVLGAWHHTYDVLKPGEYDEERCLSTFGEQLDASLHKYFPETPVDEVVSIYRDNGVVLKHRGDVVRAGEPIAYVTTPDKGDLSPHLHFELWVNGLPVNPEEYISF